MANSDHEEADTRIVLHVRERLKENHDPHSGHRRNCYSHWPLLQHS